MTFKRIQGNEIQADTLEQLYDEIRMRDEDGHPLAYINFGKFKIELRRASLRRKCVEADARIFFK